MNLRLCTLLNLAAIFFVQVYLVSFKFDAILFMYVLVMRCSCIVLPCICLSALHVDCSRRMKTCFECKAQVKVQCPSDSGMYKLFSTYCSCVLRCFYVNLQGIGVVRHELQDNSFLDSSAPHSSAQALTPHATNRKGARVRRTQLGKH